MKKISNKELKEVIQSGHLNILLGSGCSKEYLPTLNGIEEEMNQDDTRESAQKDYYQIIRKSKAIFDEALESNEQQKRELAKTKECYDNFLNFWSETISRRSLHIVNKQINIFTTNFDVFIEDSCERLNIPYNDGFSGQINRNFNVSNFNKLQRYKSLQFDNTSDIPLFNIIKLHGSISWMVRDKQIIYSERGANIPDDLDQKNGDEFTREYNKISLINPNLDKHLETVLNINYAALLRKFTLELEKENSVLIIIGFSLNDQHIKDLLYGVMKSNPTLIVIYLSYSSYDEIADPLKEKENNNLYIVAPNEHQGVRGFRESTDYLQEIFLTKFENNSNNV